MRPWRGLGSRIIAAIEHRQERKRLSAEGPLGDFYRNGGNAQLYRGLPLGEADLVLDVGGYHGEWTVGILARYGCRSEIFEPVPAFVNECRQLFEKNTRVCLHAAALGGSNRTATFSLADTGTSEFTSEKGGNIFEAPVISVCDVLQQLIEAGRIPATPGAIGCLKLNIEGGEYEVLEGLIETGDIQCFRTLLIQFHRQPPGWLARYERISRLLQTTHQQSWCYPIVWERWDLWNSTMRLGSTF